MKKDNVRMAVVLFVVVLAIVLGILFGLTSCEVVRTITNSSEYHQRGDTSVVITTKTVESYNGKKVVN